MSTALTIENRVHSLESAFNQVNKYKVDFKRESLFALQLLNSNDFLFKTAQNRPESLENAIMNIAAIGITLNPANKEAYLVPRGGAVCLDISAIGLIKLATDSNSILWGQAKLVYEKDTYRNMGVSQEPSHQYSPFGDRGKIIGGYVVVKTHNGDFLVEEMSVADCHAIRDRSEAWKAFKAGKAKSCPWHTDEGEMIKKTIIKRASKYWPKSERVFEAVELLNKIEGIDFRKEERGAYTPQAREGLEANEQSFATIRDALEAKSRTEEQLLKFINTQFSSEITSIEEMNPEMIEASYKAMGVK